MVQATLSLISEHARELEEIRVCGLVENALDNCGEAFGLLEKILPNKDLTQSAWFGREMDEPVSRDAA